MNPPIELCPCQNLRWWRLEPLLEPIDRVIIGDVGFGADLSADPVTLCSEAAAENREFAFFRDGIEVVREEMIVEEADPHLPLHRWISWSCEETRLERAAAGTAASGRRTHSEAE